MFRNYWGTPPDKDGGEEGPAEENRAFNSSIDIKGYSRIFFRMTGVLLPNSLALELYSGVSFLPRP